MQKIINGITQLPDILKGIGCENLFLVVDSSYPFLNIKETVEALPVREKTFFSDFTPNPVYEQICNGFKLLKAFDCDAILVIGGGSAIDVAKCIKLAALAEDGTLSLIPPLVSQRLCIDGSKMPLIALPTTAGTGSESTHNAVMYYDGTKQTVTNDGILPEYAFLISSVLKTLPIYQKKCTMMDALCQAIESWWSVNSTDKSKVYSKKAVVLIMDNWRKYIMENDEKAAEQIMLAANYAGRAINITQTTAPHAFSYKMTSLYKIPHGHAVAVGLPTIWEYMIEHFDRCVDPRGADYLKGIFNDISSAMDCDSPADAIGFFLQMMNQLELANPLTKSRKKDLEVLASSVNPVRLKNNPVKIGKEDALLLYDIIVR